MEWHLKCFVVIKILILCASSALAMSFSKLPAQISKAKLIVEVADTDEKRQHGLMYRRKLPTNEGMLFVFTDESIRSFWMKNTFLPLDIGFFDSKKQLVEIQKMIPVKSEMEVPKSYVSKFAAQYVLEVNQGWFQRNKIKLGDKLSF